MGNGFSEKAGEDEIIILIGEMERRMKKTMKKNRNLIILQIILSALCLLLLASSCSQMGFDDLFKKDSYGAKDLEGLTFYSDDDSLGFSSVSFFSDGKGVVSEGGRAPDKEMTYTDDAIVCNGISYVLDIQLFFDYIEISSDDGRNVVFSLEA